MNKKLLVIVLLMSLLLVSSVYGVGRSDDEDLSWAGFFRPITGTLETIVESIIGDDATAPTTTSGEEFAAESVEEKIPISQNKCNEACQSSTKCKGIDEAWRKISGVLKSHSTHIWCPGSQWNDYDAVYVPKPAVVDTSGKVAVGIYSSYVNAAASRLGVPPSLIRGLIYYESKGNAKAVSSTGCRGLMQVCRWDANYNDFQEKNPGINIRNEAFDPEANIYVGSYILSLKLIAVSDCKKGVDRIKCTIAAYNAGEGLISMAAREVGKPASWDDIINKLQDENFVKTHSSYNDERTWKIKDKIQSWTDTVGCKSLNDVTRRRCKMHNLQFYVDSVFSSIETAKETPE